jgi:hypothetical protein
VLTLFVIPSMYSFLSRKKAVSPMDLLDEEEKKKEQLELIEP